MSDDPIDVALRRAFAVPDLSALHTTIDGAAARRSARRRRRRVALLAALTAAGLILVIGRAPAPPQAIAPVEVAAIDTRALVGTELARLHAAGTRLPAPHELGPTPAPNACSDEAGPTLTDPGDLVVLAACDDALAPSCGEALPPGARVLHLRVGDDGIDVLIYIAARHDDPHPRLPDDAELRIFRRDSGDFVLYEITPADEPVALDRFAW